MWWTAFYHNDFPSRLRNFKSAHCRPSCFNPGDKFKYMVPEVLSVLRYLYTKNWLIHSIIHFTSGSTSFTFKNDDFQYYNMWMDIIFKNCSSLLFRFIYSFDALYMMSANLGCFPTWSSLPLGNWWSLSFCFSTIWWKTRNQSFFPVLAVGQPWEQ